MCTTPGCQPSLIIYAKVVFDILIGKTTETWFRDDNADSEKQEFIFYVHETIELLLSVLAFATEDFNKASFLMLVSVENVAKLIFRRRRLMRQIP